MRSFLTYYARNWLATASLIVLTLIILAAVFGPSLYGVDPFDMNGRPNMAPSLIFPLGTDVSGRDVLAELLAGARVSLAVGFASSMGATLLGMLIGAPAGYFGGWIDDVLMRVADFFLTIPSFVLAVVIVAIVTPTIWTITGTIAIVLWPSIARIVRAEFLAQRGREYVLACRGLGMGHLEVMTRQILPNVLAPIVVISSLTVATAILTEAGLSFLGLSDPNLISWGYMIGISRTMLLIVWWMPAIPGAAIVITVLAINLVGEGLNDALNPRLRPR